MINSSLLASSYRHMSKHLASIICDLKTEIVL